jgi:hypothetical protein
LNGNSVPAFAQADSTASAPFSLQRLIKAGTIVVPIERHTSRTLCSHAHAEDGWHTVSEEVFKHGIAILDSLFNALDYLIPHNFVAATYLVLEASIILIRIYLIPYDLPGLQGSLRTRPAKVISAAREPFQYLLSLVSQDARLWDGEFSPNANADLLPASNVSFLARMSVHFYSFQTQDNRTLSQIYSNLLSPSPRRVGDTKESPAVVRTVNRLLDPRDSLQGFGLRSRLYQYQRATVAAMIQQETRNIPVSDPLFISLRSIEGVNFFLQPASLEVLHEQPTVAPPQGGILCEEMGMWYFQLLFVYSDISERYWENRYNFGSYSLDDPSNIYTSRISYGRTTNSYTPFFLTLF